VADYAEPITPAESVVTDLEERSGIALDEADSDGLWANLELAEVLAVRAAMRDVVDVVTDRAEAIIIAELVAAQKRLASEYPDVPRTDLADATIKSRGQ
jgi:NOL1/NOP2/fmu family ribosome biogenesis protein